MSPLLEKPKEAALRAVGRTVVNFQRLEHNLKLAARLGPVQGTFQKVQRDFEKRKERAQSLTLGQAIQAWLSYLEGDPNSTTWIPDLFDYSVCMTFSLESDSSAPDTHAETLRSLLETRNSLVHTRLATFPWSSEEACAELVVELDAVNASVVEQLDYVAALVREIERVHKENAEEFVAAIEAAHALHSTGEAIPNPPLERP